jgi:DNA (cytosine-5)-methyltransferase 1
MQRDKGRRRPEPMRKQSSAPGELEPRDGPRLRLTEKGVAQPEMADRRSTNLPGRSYEVTGLFSGIGGLELGLRRAGHRAIELCEIWEPARRVLSSRFPGVPIHGDVTAVSAAAGSLLTAGFPCTDLSPSGSKAGIGGNKSGLVNAVFDIAAVSQPEWILLENVTNMLVLHGGAAMRLITGRLDDLGYRWAYRTVDARFTGVPQRRRRVLIVATNGKRDPAAVLLADDVGEPDPSEYRDDAYGFYWTEGRGGLGWAVDAIPTLKGGSTIGIASPPALWLPNEALGAKLVLPAVADGERLQGFPAGWTDAAVTEGDRDHRWKLIGNAVPVGIAEWIGRRLASSDPSPALAGTEFDVTKRWPDAGYGARSLRVRVDVSAWPERMPYQHLHDAIDVSRASALSHRAAAGFQRRLDESGLKIEPRFAMDLESHVVASRPPLTAKRRPASWASSPGARRRMQAARGKDTGPELELRREMHARGLRYRIHARPISTLRNRVDVVFPRAKVAIDVRGCFWHACELHGTKPHLNGDRWAEKLAKNRERDARIVEALQKEGWQVIIVWEHDDVKTSVDMIEQAVRTRAQRR